MLSLPVIVTFVISTITLAAAAKPPLTVIFSADDGTFSGSHEQRLILERFNESAKVDTKHCQSCTLGTVSFGDSAVVDLLLVTSGIGPTVSTACAREVLGSIVDALGFSVKEGLLTGTSGISPLRGGLNPPLLTNDTNETNSSLPKGCEENSTEKMERNTLGSVCVSSGSYDVHCGFDVEAPEEIKHGECYNKNNLSLTELDEKLPPKFLFGECFFHTGDAGKALVNRIMDANRRASFPAGVEVSEGLKGQMKKYWDAFKFGSSTEQMTPVITSHCMEATSHNIWVGAIVDFVCRVRAAQYLKQMGVYNSSLPTFCVTAMEGYGVLNVASQLQIPMAVFRGASNFDMFPLQLVKGVNGTNTTVWKQHVAFMTQEEDLEFKRAGYQLAINSTNTAILNYLKTVAMETASNITPIPASDQAGSLGYSVAACASMILALVVAMMQ